MRLLTRYSGSTLLQLRPGTYCLSRDAASTPAPKRASFWVRVPYYVFLTGMAAVYYGYVSAVVYPNARTAAVMLKCCTIIQNATYRSYHSTCAG